MLQLRAAACNNRKRPIKAGDEEPLLTCLASRSIAQHFPVIFEREGMTFYFRLDLTRDRARIPALNGETNIHVG